ncbi:amidase family protein [Arthrobacter sp. ISL-30]|uniref:amidase family protein n=1 Tax=Arthrobacter sp. ISL-30 TaxID=2819109 RepID=UPI002035629B|nr:amidase family protein [Arthrobacter sp. ISL-30]
MARTVADAALLAGVMVGRHPGDHTSLADRPGLWREEAAAPDLFGPLAGKRIALSIRLGNYLVAPDVEANTRSVAAALREAGALVEEIELHWTSEEISRTMFTHFGYLLGPAMEDETVGSEELLAPYTRRFMADARKAAESHRFLDGVRAETRIQAELAASIIDARSWPFPAVWQTAGFRQACRSSATRSMMPPSSP